MTRMRTALADSRGMRTGAVGERAALVRAGWGREVVRTEQI
jgi:hypothetical protein